MEAKILAVMAVICVLVAAIKLVMTEVASVVELWKRLRRGGEE